MKKAALVVAARSLDVPAGVDPAASAEGTAADEPAMRGC